MVAAMVKQAVSASCRAEIAYKERTLIRTARRSEFNIICSTHKLCIQSFRVRLIKDVQMVSSSCDGKMTMCASGDFSEDLLRIKIKEAIKIHRTKTAVNKKVDKEPPPFPLQFV